MSKLDNIPSAFTGRFYTFAVLYIDAFYIHGGRGKDGGDTVLNDTWKLQLPISSRVGIGTTNPRCTMDISATDALIIPVGTTSDRPFPSNLYEGMIRYNTTTVQFEGYGPGGAWGSLGGIKDVDGDTYIQAETSAGTDNDDLEFFTSGNQRMIIDSSGNVGIGTVNPNTILHLAHIDGDALLKVERNAGGSYDGSISILSLIHI